MKTNAEFVAKKLPEHLSDAHKYNRGKVMIIGGSIGLTGAVCMTAEAAMRSGAGLVTAAVPMSLNQIFEIKLTEVMTLPLKDENGNITVSSVQDIIKFASNCDVIAIGPGAGTGEGVVAALYALCDLDKKLIIDADAITALAKNPDMLLDKNAEILITPHIGEMSRLIDVPCDEILSKREEYAVNLAKKYGINVLLKGKDTIVTNGGDVYINPTGNNGMAKGGSGDVLTGICAGLAAQGLSCFESGVVGAYIHGLSGDIAKEKYTDYAMIPTDIIDNLGVAFKKITEM